MKRLFRVFIFFTGWILSPFTWWNDAFVNMPLSYLIANFIYYLMKLPFKWLVIGSYWFTNLLGIYFMYFGGKQLMVSSKNKSKTAILLILFIIVYSAIMLYLDKEGKLIPICEYFEKLCVQRQ